MLIEEENKQDIYIPDVTTDEDEANKIAHRLNEGQPEDVHFEEVLDEMRDVI